MDRFLIMTDSTADLPDAYLESEHIPILKLYYEIDGHTYGGNTGEEMDVADFYAKMRSGLMTKTSQVNPEEAKEVLSRYIADGYKEILYLAFSSGLSGTYNSVWTAAKDLEQEHSDVHIEVIDTLCASLGEGLIVYKAAKLRSEGKSMNETAQWVRDHVLNLVHMFTVDDLNFLYRGGRVSKGAAVLGTIAGIKPVLHVDNEGHLIPVAKVRGRKKSLIKLVDYMEQKMGSYKDQNDIVFISHGDCLEDAQFVAEEVKRRFGIESFMYNYVGSTIGSHSGPGTIALFFLGDER